VRHRLHVCSDNIIAKCHDRRLNVKSFSFSFYQNKGNNPFYITDFYVRMKNSSFYRKSKQTVFCHPVPKTPEKLLIQT